MIGEKIDCSVCDGSGYIIYMDEKGYEFCKECDCMKLRRARELLERSGITKEFQKKNFENYVTGENKTLIDAKKTAETYVKYYSEQENKRNNSILFLGQVGAGKTHLGIAVSAELLENGIEVIYMPYRNEITAIKQKMLDEQEYSRRIDLYSKARVLLILAYAMSQARVCAFGECTRVKYPAACCGVFD